jgi:hypothetical protein
MAKIEPCSQSQGLAIDVSRLVKRMGVEEKVGKVTEGRSVVCLSSNRSEGVEIPDKQCSVSLVQFVREGSFK